MYTRIQELRYRKFNYLNLNRSTSSRVAILVFLLTSIIIIAIAERIEKQKLAKEQIEVTNLAQEYSNKIQTNLEKTLSITYPLAALVKEYQGTIPNFEIIGQELLALYPSAYAVALLPDNGNSQVVFSKPNQNSLERLTTPCAEYQQQVLISQESNKPLLADPLPPQQTFTNSVGCLPVFLENSEEEKLFWGFASVVINYQQLLKQIDLEYLATRNLAYVLNFIEPISYKQEQISSSSDIQYQGKRAIHQMVPLPGGFWKLSIFPTTTWNQSSRFLVYSLLGIFVSFLVSALVKLLLDSKVHAEELEKVAYFDPLTSLPNRRLLLYRLNQLLSTAERKQTNIAICYLDLDDFKRINDRLGNKAGDYILVRIAKRLQKFLRTDDVIARIGGDEFAIVLKDITSLEEAELIIARILEAVTTPIVLETEIIAVSTSIGITVYPKDNSSNENLLRHANQAMLLAKQYRKGSYIAYKEVNQLELPSS